MAKNVDTGWGNDASYHRDVRQREILHFLVPLFQTNTVVQSSMRASRKNAMVSLSSFPSVEGEHSPPRYPSIYEMYVFLIVAKLNLRTIEIFVFVW